MDDELKAVDVPTVRVFAIDRPDDHGRRDVALVLEIVTRKKEHRFHRKIGC